MLRQVLEVNPENGDLQLGEEDKTHQCQKVPNNNKMGIKCQGQTNCCQQKAKTDSTSYLIDVVWDGRLRYIDYYSHQRSLTE